MYYWIVNGARNCVHFLYIRIEPTTFLLFFKHQRKMNSNITDDVHKLILYKLLEAFYHV